MPPPRLDRCHSNLRVRDPRWGSNPPYRPRYHMIGLLGPTLTCAEEALSWFVQAPQALCERWDGSDPFTGHFFALLT